MKRAVLFTLFVLIPSMLGWCQLCPSSTSLKSLSPSAGTLGAGTASKAAGEGP
jgi:hypothetical protein